jgi:hypothetical protein
VFTTDDEDVMAIFLAIAGPILAESNLYEQIQGKSKGRGVEGTGGEGRPAAGGTKPGEAGHGHAASKKTMAGLTEGAEEEDEEEEEAA